MEDGESTFFAGDRHAWRRWLECHHATETSVWLIMHRKGVDEPGVTLDEAVEEALCFGWIDSRLRRIDDRSYRLRFSPRRPDSVWSESNRVRVARLIAEGRMTEAGMTAVAVARERGRWDAVTHERLDKTPPDLRRALAVVPAATDHWRSWPPSYRRQYVYWVLAAKKPETRTRRIDDVVRRAAEGRRPGDTA